jgi:hypothetical protein
MNSKLETHIIPSLLNRVHEPIKMGAERLQARGIQQETALGRGVRGSAARAAAGVAQRDLLVLAEELDFARREAQLRVGDGRGGHLEARAKRRGLHIPPRCCHSLPLHELIGVDDYCETIGIGCCAA